MVKLILAIGKNGLIGKGNEMAWNISEEFKHFKETTMGDDLLFGQTTFLGLPKKLEGRKSIVLGFEKTDNADISITSTEELEKLFSEYSDSNKTLWICGGKSIYEQFYQYANELVISEVKDDYQGNVYLNLDLSNYSKELIKEEEKFNVFKYIKKG